MVSLIPVFPGPVNSPTDGLLDRDAEVAKSKGERRRVEMLRRIEAKEGGEKRLHGDLRSVAAMS